MIKLKQKKASHVGMILSFVIFITFLVFLFSITQPITQRERGKEDLLSYLKTELVKEFSAEMTTATISVSQSAENCIKMPVITGINEENAIVKNGKNLEVLEHSKNGNIEIKRAGADVLKIYYSNDFPEKTDSLNCDLIDEGDYNIGLVRTTEHIFETEIISMIDNFEQNYPNIKSLLGVAGGDNFGFSFKDNEGLVTETEFKNVSKNIYVEEFPIQYVDNKANINAGFLSIRVW